VAELTPLERLQPSLLDRLTDDEPTHAKESREKRVYSIRRLKESVLRDLAWLLNTTDMGQSLDSASYPEVAASVLNYGIPDLAGVTSSTISSDALSKEVRRAILNFEPRICPHELRVDVVAAEDAMNHNSLTMRIEGELWAVPVPLHLLVDTSVDLESGTIAVIENGGAS
jgi:type VI secretion system protein ImpF